MVVARSALSPFRWGSTALEKSQEKQAFFFRCGLANPAGMHTGLDTERQGLGTPTS
jgi:hypothetical protein